jgi:predicted PurR-regulated permease PerM
VSEPQPEQRLSSPWRVWYWLAAACALVILLVLLGPILTPFAFGAVLAYMLAPGVNWLQRHRIPRAIGSLVMLVLVCGLSALLLLILLPVLQKEALALQQKFPAMIERLNTSVLPWLNTRFQLNVQLDFASLQQLVSDKIADNGQDLMARLFGTLRSGTGVVLGFLVNAVLVPMVLFYFMLDWPDMTSRVQALLPRRWEPMVMDLAHEIDALLSQFLRGQLLVMLLLAAFYSSALAIAGFDVALPVGILTGLLVFIPYIGYGTGLVLALVSALLQFEPGYGLTAVAIVYGLGQVLEGFVLTPRLVGKRIGLHPLAVIFALMAFGQLFGFVGVLIALPVSATLLVGLKRLRARYLASNFYRAAP